MPAHSRPGKEHQRDAGDQEVIHEKLIIGSGVWYCESRDYLTLHCSDYGALKDSEKHRMRQLNRKYPLHCIVGGSGFRDVHATWPKPGLYCKDCGAFTIKAKPY